MWKLYAGPCSWTTISTYEFIADNGVMNKISGHERFVLVKRYISALYECSWLNCYVSVKINIKKILALDKKVW